MPYGLTKATNYYNNVEARRDWYRACDEAQRMGRADLIVDAVPQDFSPELCGWRRLDKYTDKLKAAIEATHNGEAA